VSVALHVLDVAPEADLQPVARVHRRRAGVTCIYGLRCRVERTGIVQALVAAEVEFLAAGPGEHDGRAARELPRGDLRVCALPADVDALGPHLPAVLPVRGEIKLDIARAWQNAERLAVVTVRRPGRQLVRS